MGGEPSQPDLLAYALFDQDPRVAKLREPLLAFLISVALFELGRPADHEEILKACEEQFLSNDGVVLHQIDEAVSKGRHAGLFVAEKEGKFDLSSDRRTHLAEAADQIAGQRRSFHRSISTAVERELSEELRPAIASKLESALEHFIQELFQEQSVALANAFGPNGRGFDVATANRLHLGSLERLARSVVPIGSKARRKKAATGIRTGLLELDTAGQRYLAAVYQKTVTFALLQQDPSVRKVKHTLARKRVFYLDTNVVMALMFSAHGLHDHVRTAVGAAVDVGCELLVSPFTLKELEIQLNESADSFRKLEALEPAFGDLSDDILRTFGLAREKSPGLTWDAFFATHFPPDEALAEFGIERSDAEAAAAQHDERFAQVRHAVERFKPDRSHPKQIDYDAYNLLLVQRRRDELPPDEMGNRVWLVTLDRSLRETELLLHEGDTYEVPSSMRVDAWLADLSPHLSPDDADLGEYALHVVQSQLGLLAEDQGFADVNFLSILQESPFDLSELLTADPVKTKRVLVALQERREIEQILSEEPDEPRARDAWAERLAEIVKNTLDKLDETSDKEATIRRIEAERDDAKRAVVSAREAEKNSMRRIAELQRKIERDGKEKPSLPKRVVRWLAGGG